MDLKKCFSLVGSDYDEVFARIPNDALIYKVLFRFLEDKTVEQLCTALEENRKEEAFYAVHTLKGLCSNLGLKNLQDSASELTELLRVQNKSPQLEEVAVLLEQVKKDYQVAVEVIQQLKEDGKY